MDRVPARSGSRRRRSLTPSSLHALPRGVPPGTRETSSVRMNLAQESRGDLPDVAAVLLVTRHRLRDAVRLLLQPLPGRPSVLRVTELYAEGNAAALTHYIGVLGTQTVALTATASADDEAVCLALWRPSVCIKLQYVTCQASEMRDGKPFLSIPTHLIQCVTAACDLPVLPIEQDRRTDGTATLARPLPVTVLSVHAARSLARNDCRFACLELAVAAAHILDSVEFRAAVSDAAVAASALRCIHTLPLPLPPPPPIASRTAEETALRKSLLTSSSNFVAVNGWYGCECARQVVSVAWSLRSNFPVIIYLNTALPRLGTSDFLQRVMHVLWRLGVRLPRQDPCLLPDVLELLRDSLPMHRPCMLILDGMSRYTSDLLTSLCAAPLPRPLRVVMIHPPASWMRPLLKPRMLALQHVVFDCLPLDASLRILAVPDSPAARRLVHVLGGLPVLLRSARRVLSTAEISLDAMVVMWEENPRFFERDPDVKSVYEMAEVEFATHVWPMNPWVPWMHPDDVVEVLRLVAGAQPARSHNDGVVDWKTGKTIPAIQAALRVQSYTVATHFRSPLQMIRTLGAFVSMFDLDYTEHWETIRVPALHAHTAMRHLQRLWQRGVFRLEPGPLLSWLDFTVDVISNYLSLTGQLHAAVSLFEFGLQISLTQYGPDHRESSVAFNNMGTYYREIGWYAAAEDMVKASLAITARVDGVNSAEYAISLGVLANLQFQQFRSDKAIEMYARSRGIYYDLDNGTSLSYAVQTAMLARVYIDKGDVKQAESLLDVAKTIVLNTLGAGSHRFAELLHLRGLVRHRQGKKSQAEALIKSAMDLYIKTHTEQHEIVTYARLSLAMVRNDVDGVRAAHARLLRLTSPQHRHVREALIWLQRWHGTQREQARRQRVAQSR